MNKTSVPSGTVAEEAERLNKRSAYYKQYYEKNKEKAKQYQRDYNRTHKKKPSGAIRGRRGGPGFMSTREAVRMTYTLSDIMHAEAERAARMLDNVLKGKRDLVR